TSSVASSRGRRCRSATVPRDVIGMLRRGFCCLADDRAHLVEIPAQLLNVLLIYERIVTLRPDVLSHQHREPIGCHEELRTVSHDAATIAELIDLVPQRVGYRHVRAVAPEWRIFTRCGFVVEDDEVAGPVVLPD